MKTKRAKVTKHVAAPVESPSKPAKITETTWKKDGDTVSIKMIVASPASPWLPITSKKTGLQVLLPLPIRMIQRLPAENGHDGGCLVRGAHGDESTAKESVLEILEMLNGYPLGDVAEWRLAT